jgi:hypothetical protein
VRACPYCAEQIRDAAILCRYCGKSVTPVAPSPEQKRSLLASPVIGCVILALLAVVVGIALLYAYRAQGPTSAVVSYDKAVIEIQSGQVAAVTINLDIAMLDKRDGSKETVNIGSNDAGAFEKVVLDYNTSQTPDRRVQLRLQQGSPPIGFIGSVLLSLLPLVLVLGFAGLIGYLIGQARRR